MYMHTHKHTHAFYAELNILKPFIQDRHFGKGGVRTLKIYSFIKAMTALVQIKVLHWYKCTNGTLVQMYQVLHWYK